MKNYFFRADDFLHALKDWKLEPLSDLEKLKVLNFLLSDIDSLNANEWAFGENDIESFILEIISED